ncbi:MAG: hypothetical protein QOG57_4283, partial [Pseudonocardiales bacterium]|nr:hypothetical protein [Pseudonocardiales bacterium]
MLGDDRQVRTGGVGALLRVLGVAREHPLRPDVALVGPSRELVVADGELIAVHEHRPAVQRRHRTGAVGAGSVPGRTATPWGSSR